MRFDGGGLQCAVGTSNGLVALYDLRMSRPTAIRDHMYGEPILDIKFHQVPGSAGMVLLQQPVVLPLNHPLKDERWQDMACVE